MRLLAKNPNDRYPSAEDLRADLRRFREGQPVLAAGAAGVAAAATMATPAAAANATTALPVTPAPASAAPEYYYDEDDDEYDDSPNRTGWFIAGLVALVAVLVGLLAIFANALGIGGERRRRADRGAGVLLLTEAEATEILEDAGFEVVVEYEANVDLEPGIVFRQDPLDGLDGTRRQHGHHLRQRKATNSSRWTPWSVGFFESEVIPFLEGKGLVLGNVEYVFDDDSVDGEVLSQFPPPGQLVAAGTAFDLVVSRGPEQVEIPDVRRRGARRRRGDPDRDGASRSGRRGVLRHHRRRIGHPHRTGASHDGRSQQLRDRRRGPRRGRGSSAAGRGRLPVRIDSGWNCTPSTSSSRWRRPITMPSSVSAVISSTSGTVSRSTISEW
jgi:hypothetical protein